MAPFTKSQPVALGELQRNSQEQGPRTRSRSPTKLAFSKLSSKSRDPSPTKSPKKTKSGTNIAGLLSRPKSLRGLHKLATDDDVRVLKDKENWKPDDSLSPPPLHSPTPIYAQFTSDPLFKQQQQMARSSADMPRTLGNQELPGATRPGQKERPKSFQVPPVSGAPPTARQGSGSSGEKTADSRGRSRFMSALSSYGHGRSKSTTLVSAPTSGPTLDPKNINTHLEAMLDRRNIPENQRYKMRNLADTIKMEFIRQDWAEMNAAGKAEPTTSSGSTTSRDEDSAVAAGSDCEEDKPKRTRGKSFTFSRGRKDGGSPMKASSKGEGTLGRHFRSKSTESIASERPSSAGNSSGTNILNKIKFQQGPAEYVAYLRKVQKPDLVEVGKLHKLRLLLRNETVAWTEDFIQQGGMMEIVGLLKRTMAVEWR